MFNKNFGATFSALAGLLVALPTANAASDPTGVWINNTGRGAVEIKKCGTRLCGHVVWVKNKKDRKGCGTQILGNVRKVGKRTWDKGWIYSPERGRKFSVELKPLKNGKLRVLGYAGSKFFSKKMFWTPAPDTLERCDSKGETVASKKNETKNTKVAAVDQDATLEPSEKRNKRSTRRRTRTSDEPKPSSSSRNRETIENDDYDVEDEDNYETKTSRRSKKRYNDDDYDNEAEDTGEDYVSEGIGNLDLGKMNVKKFFKVKGGRCKLNTPWIKLDFRCDK